MYIGEKTRRARELFKKTKDILSLCLKKGIHLLHGKMYICVEICADCHEQSEPWYVIMFP
jgi:hypothetical protein